MRSSVVRVLSAALALASSAVVHAAAPAPVAVATCGQEVPRGTVGYLTGDLDCSGSLAGGIEGMAVILHDHATLELRGFTLAANKFAVGCYEPTDVPNVYRNAKRCRIVGAGGAITNASVQAVNGGAGKIWIDHTTFSGNEYVLFNFRDVRLRNVTMTGNQQTAAAVDELRLENSSATSNGLGLSARRIKLSGSSALDNGSFDLASVRRPIVKKGSTCGTAVGPGNTVWDVCRGF